MVNRRATAFMSATAIVLAACAGGPTATGSGQARATSGSPAPAALVSPVATTSGCVVGVSWADLSGRWATRDEPAIKEALAAAGASYVSTDAKSSAATQASNVDSLISQGVKVLIVVAQDGNAIEPSVATATRQGIPVIAYERLIEDPHSLYVAFDNVEVGRMQARALLKAAPTGNYVFIKGDQGDASTDLLRSGQDEVLGAAIKSGAIKNVGESYTANWDPDAAQSEMEQFLTANGDKIDAVVSENDGMAFGVISALAAHHPAAQAAVSGQDGDADGLNAVALGRQTVDVWKDMRVLGKTAGEAAVRLCAGVAVDKISGVVPFKTPAGNTLSSILFKPIPITQDNLDVVVDAGWITKDMLCYGVTAGSVAACP